MADRPPVEAIRAAAIVLQHEGFRRRNSIFTLHMQEIYFDDQESAREDGRKLLAEASKLEGVAAWLEAMCEERPPCDNCGAPRWDIFTLCQPCYEAWADEQARNHAGE